MIHPFHDTLVFRALVRAALQPLPQPVRHRVVRCAPYIVVVSRPGEHTAPALLPHKLPDLFILLLPKERDVFADSLVVAGIRAELRQRVPGWLACNHK